MKITVLGCGTSTGVPIPGCSCSVCNSDDPKNFRNRTSAYLEFQENYGVLIDASTDLRHQALQWNVTHVESVLFTHGHADHILGIDDLRVFNFKGKSISCYGTKETLQTIKDTFSYLFNKNEGYQGGMLADLILHEINYYQPFELAGKTIIPILLYHGKMPVTGYRIGDMVYATDCNSIPEKSLEAMKGARYLFLDALRHKPHPTHNTIEAAIKIAKSLGVEKTYFIHMTHNLDYSETNSTLPDGIELAYDGLEVVV